MNKQILTYSALRKFQVCRRAYYNRYRQDLVPLEQSEALFLGTVIHNCLESWHDPGEGFVDSRAIITEAYPKRESDEKQKRDWHLARAMMTGYKARFPGEDFEVVETETEFRVPIINPQTNRSSQSFEFRGKVDGLIRMNGQYFILEHKTAALVTGDYIERLPLDFQINLYALALSHYKNIPIAGVLYNVIQKSKLRQKQGESEEEFEVRRQALIQKSKTGKTSAKRKSPESDEDFQKRLADVYAAPSMFVREMLYFSRADLDRTQQELWELTQEILDAQRRGHWSLNTDSCFRYFGPCPYFPLCRAHENPNILDNLYTKSPAHSELSVGSDA